MNSLAKLSKHFSLLLGLASIAGATFLFQPTANSAENLDRPFDWTVEIDTKPMKNQFQYTGSELKELIKAKVSFYKMSDEDNKTDYEDLWYAKSKTLGMERHHKLDITQGDAVCIKVKHLGDSTSYDEQRSAAKAVMKMVLDTTINKNMVATIKVPASSFSTISAEIQNYNFVPAGPSSPDNPVDSDLNLFLESEPSGQTQSFNHLH